MQRNSSATIALIAVYVSIVLAGFVFYALHGFQLFEPHVTR